jgi:hypothetical protein
MQRNLFACLSCNGSFKDRESLRQHLKQKPSHRQQYSHQDKSSLKKDGLDNKNRNVSLKKENSAEENLKSATTIQLSANQYSDDKLGKLLALKKEGKYGEICDSVPLNHENTNPDTSTSMQCQVYSHAVAALAHCCLIEKETQVDHLQSVISHLNRGRLSAVVFSDNDWDVLVQVCFDGMGDLISKEIRSVSRVSRVHEGLEKAVLQLDPKKSWLTSPREKSEFLNLITFFIAKLIDTPDLTYEE